MEFPNPQKEFMLCGRRNASFVCDPEFLMDIGDVERLDHLAKEFRKSTTCLCSRCENGISLGIFVKRNLTQEAARQYPNGRGVAEMLRNRWHMGKCNDDIVIILLTELNISDYSMGPAVREIFPDATAKQIMKDCSIHFSSGWYYQGLESVVNSFHDGLRRLQKEKKGLDMSLITGLSLGIGVLLILLIISIIVLRRQNKRRKAGCSNIYESVSTKNKYLNEKINEYQLDKIHEQSNADDEDEEGYMSDEDNSNMQSTKLLQLKRQLSSVAEESSDENETLEKSTEMSFNSLSSSQHARSLQVTEL